MNPVAQELFARLIRMCALISRDALIEVSKNPPAGFDKVLARINSGELTPFLIVSSVPAPKVTFAVGNETESIALYDMTGTEVRPKAAALN